MIYLFAIIHLLLIAFVWRIGYRLTAISLGVFFIVAQISLVSVALGGDYSILSTEAVDRVGRLVFFSLLSFVIGVLFVRGTFKFSHHAQKLDFVTIYRVPTHVILLVLCISVVGFSLYLAALQNAGIDLLRITAERGIESAYEVSLYKKWLASFFTPIALLMFVEGRYFKIQHWNFWILLVLSVVWLVIQGGRMAMLQYALMFILLIIYAPSISKRQNDTKRFINIQKHSSKIKRPFRLILFSTLGMGILLIALTVYRSVASDAESSHGFDQLTNGAYGGLDTTAYIVNQAPSIANLNSLFDWVYMPIPREIWPDKPANLGQRISIEMGSGLNFGGSTVNFYGEMYRIGWFFTVFIGLFFAGALTAIVDVVLRQRRSVFSILMMVYLFVYFFITLWLVSFSDCVVSFLMNLMPTAIIILMSKRKRISMLNIMGKYISDKSEQPGLKVLARTGRF